MRGGPLINPRRAAFIVRAESPRRQEVARGGRARSRQNAGKRERNAETVPMKRWLGNRASLSLGVTFALLAVIAVVSFLTTRRLLEEAKSVEHTYDVRETLAAVLTDLTDAETGQRGYLLTGDPAYLKPYLDARKVLDRDLKNLRDLTADNPRQQARLDFLEPVVRARIAALERNIALRRAGDTAAAIALVHDGRGKRLMDQARTLVAEAEAEEQRLLDERAARSARAARTALLVEALGGLVGLCLLGVSTGFVNRHIAARVRAEAALEGAYAKQKRIAETLQRSLLIEPPPDTFGGLSIARFTSRPGTRRRSAATFTTLFRFPTAASRSWSATRAARG
jgi:CHASE3 domain sensor protein